MIDAEPFHGGCQCGAIRYTISLKNLVAYACHCSECKRQSTSSFAVSVPIPSKYFHLTGVPNKYKRSTDSGTSTNCFFCPNCGVRVYHQSDRSPELVTVKGGTLDDLISLPLDAHLWTKRKHAWIELHSNAEVYETQPEDLKQWRSKLISKLEAI